MESLHAAVAAGLCQGRCALSIDRGGERQTRFGYDRPHEAHRAWFVSEMLLGGARGASAGATLDPMSREQPKNALHGVTLERIVTELVAHYGWSELGQQVDIRCFRLDPSVSSSLKFLRRTPWARAKVESLYQFMLREQARALKA
jgi:hypothetical protein